MVEFALVAPLLVTLIFAIVEAGLLLYVYNSAQHASTVAQETIAAEGTQNTADLDAIDAIHRSDFGQTGLIHITGYTVYMLAPDGSNKRDTSGCGGTGCVEAYVPASCPGNAQTAGGLCLTRSGNWLPAARITASTTASYVELDVTYDYRPFGLPQSVFHLTAQRFFRLEPQSI